MQHALTLGIWNPYGQMAAFDDNLQQEQMHRYVALVEHVAYRQVTTQ